MVQWRVATVGTPRLQVRAQHRTSDGGEEICRIDGVPSRCFRLRPDRDAEFRKDTRLCMYTPWTTWRNQKGKGGARCISSKLETLCCSKDMPVEERISSANSLREVMTRTRNSDWRFKSALTQSRNRILAIEDQVKTSHAQDREELALVGPMVSCTGLEWLAADIEFREQEGIPLETLPPLPARDANGWINEEASLVATNQLHKRVMQRIGEDPSRITSHTLKRTAVTIAAREGMTREEQSFLAYHKIVRKRRRAPMTRQGWKASCRNSKRL